MSHKKTKRLITNKAIGNGLFYQLHYHHCEVLRIVWRLTINDQPEAQQTCFVRAHLLAHNRDVEQAIFSGHRGDLDEHFEWLAFKRIPVSQDDFLQPKNTPYQVSQNTMAQPSAH